jgi:subfamily B ATP-binding cassette protein HlyB/CyaB
MTLVSDWFRHSYHCADRVRYTEDQNVTRAKYSPHRRIPKSFLMEALAGVETIKGMGMERPVRLRWEKKYAKSLEVQYRVAGVQHCCVGLGSQLLNAATTIAILWVGANLVLARELTIGQLIAFNAFMGSVLGPLMGLVSLWSMLNDAGVAMERLGDVLDIEPEQKPEDLAVARYPA